MDPLHIYKEYQNYENSIWPEKASYESFSAGFKIAFDIAFNIGKNEGQALESEKNVIRKRIEPGF